jgi:RNA polymerase sigma-70 factor, ECF subfamily
MICGRRERFGRARCLVIVSEREGPGLTRGELVELAGQQERAAAFRRLSERRLDPSYRLARAIVGEPAEAEDAVQDAFLQAWRQWPSLRDPDRIEAWFDRILVNSCRNRLRSRSRARIVDISVSVEIAQAGDQYAAANDRDQLGIALGRLDVDHRLVVALRYYGDFTVDQIAARTGLRPGTVKSRLHHGLRRLHALLDDTGSGAPR